jgi:hypothetical protein
MANRQQPRGIRNNNPGNIDRTPKRTPWQGQVPVQDLTDPRFEQFTHAKWGIRAICRVLVTYQDRHGLDSVREIIDRWAPPVENNTEAYVQAVARKLGVSASDAISVHDYATMRELVLAIIKHENGIQPYSGALIDEGLRLAGIVPPQPKPASRDPVNVGGAVALAGAGAEVASRAAEQPAVQQIAEQSDVLNEALPLVSMIGGYALTFTVLAALGLLAYRWWQRRQGVE